MAPVGNGSVERRYSTGDVFLDRRVDGGIPAQSLLALVARPETQSQAILRQFAGTRRTLYVSTACPDPEELRAGYLPPDADADPLYASSGTLLDAPGEVLDRIEPETFVVLDALNAVEEDASRAELLALLNDLKRRLAEVDSVGVLHCLRDERNGSPRTTTLHRADVVWQLVPDYGTRQLGYRLLVTKARDSRALQEPIPLVITDRVEIDTSWSI